MDEENERIEAVEYSVENVMGIACIHIFDQLRFICVVCKPCDNMRSSLDSERLKLEDMLDVNIMCTFHLAA